MEDAIEVTLADLMQRLNVPKQHACYLVKVLQRMGLAHRCGFRKRPTAGRPANLWRVPRCLTLDLS